LGALVEDEEMIWGCEMNEGVVILDDDDEGAKAVVELIPVRKREINNMRKDFIVSSDEVCLLKV
jgi:hypothetical protein